MSQFSTDILQDSTISSKSFKEKCKEVAKVECMRILDQKQVEHEKQISKLKLQIKNLLANSETKDKKIRQLQDKIEHLERCFQNRLEQSISVEGLKGLSLSIIQNSQMMDHQGHINNLEKENQRLREEIGQLRSRLEDYTKRQYSAISVQDAICQLAQNAESKGYLKKFVKQGPFKAYFIKKNKMIDFYSAISVEEVQLEIKVRASTILSIYIQKNN